MPAGIPGRGNLTYLYCISKMNRPMKQLRIIPVMMLCLVLATIGHGQPYTPAQPYGDNKLVNDFICSEVVYPEQALEKDVEGKVILGFIVNADGNVSDIRVKEGVSPEIDREAIRVFRLLQWKPAIKLGNPVRSEEEFTFKFNIKKYERQCKQRGYNNLEYPFMPVDTSITIYSLEDLDRPPEPIFTTKGMTLEKFIIKNLVYPEAAYKQNIAGKVLMSFIVETHGGPSNILVEKTVGGGCTEEALRIMKMIRWMPGIKDDTAVRSRIQMSITFNLPSDTDTKVFDNNQGAI
jgi:TonB family protein